MSPVFFLAVSYLKSFINDFRILSESTSSAVSQYAFTHFFNFFSFFAPKQVSYTLLSLGLLRGETFFLFNNLEN
jgi:hypothetical protein